MMVVELSTRRSLCTTLKIYRLSYIVCRLYRYIVFHIGIKRFDHVSLRIYFDFNGIYDLFVLWRGIYIARPTCLEMQGEAKIRQ